MASLVDHVKLDELPNSVWLAIAVLVGLTILAILYPDRLAFTHKNVIGAPEGPMFRHPILGHTAYIIRRREDTLDGLWDFQRYPGEDGTQLRWPKTTTFLPLGRIWLVNRPEYLEHIQKTNFLNYPKGKSFSDLFADLLGLNGIFVADGDVWKAQRKLASHVFSVGNFKTHVQTILHKELDVVHGLFTKIAQSGQAVNLQDIFFRFTLASFGQLAFNQDFDCLPSHPNDLDRDVPFATAFDYAQKRVDLRLTNPVWKLYELLSPAGFEMRRAKRVVQEYARSVIDHRLEQRKQGKGALAGVKQGIDAAKGGRDLLDLFLDQGLDREALVETVLNMIIAGRDTTAQALSWQFWELSQRPDVAAKCRDEAQRVLGNRKANYDDLPELPYFTAVFYETLRLHPSVPKNMKEIAADDTLPAIPSEGIPAIPVKRGERVIWSDWVMARMPEIWGPDCEEFRPERWIDDAGRLRKESTFKFHAFNAGPRLCLGQTLATFEGVGSTAFILTHFDVNMLPQQETPKYGNSLTHPIKNPYLVNIAVR